MFSLTSCFLFSWNKNTENLWYIDFLSFVFLDLLKITFIVTTISFYPKWDFCSQLKTLIIFIFWLFPVFIFTENVFRNPTKHIFITVFCFHENANRKQPNQTPLSYWIWNVMFLVILFFQPLIVTSLIFPPKLKVFKQNSYFLNPILTWLLKLI